MPIYTYRCQSCGDLLEKRQSFSDAPLTTCETCGGELRKVIHPAGIVFKGSGFYNTDYRGNGTAKSPAKTEGDGKADSTDGSSDKKTETPAAAATKSESTPSSTPAAAASA